MQPAVKKKSIRISESLGSVSSLIMQPEETKAVLVLAHGAGAGMTHRFMESLSIELANFSVATMRFNFPYMENGRKRPDPPAIAEKTVAVILEETHRMFSGVPLVAGGKSFGGRMTSQRLAKECPDFVKRIVFFGFPLHPAGKPSVDRAKHLSGINIPMLFLQGTRDTLAQIDLLSQVCSGLPKATLIKVEGADHSFKLGKQDLVPLLAEQTVEWLIR